MVSIIVPVYNVEKYLRRCVNSLINQSFTNNEIILVDDGSSDNSSVLCDYIKDQYENIQVIHKGNGGLSSARNAGLAAAKGEYITFVDSDDWLAQDAIEYAMSLIETYGADVAEYSYIEVYDEDEKPKMDGERIQVFHKKEILQYYMMNHVTKTGEYSVCRCLFKRKAIDGLFFREGKTSEDLDYEYKALMNCDVYVSSNLAKYFYFQTGNSISTGGLKISDFDLYDAVAELKQLTSKEAYGTIAYLGEVKEARTAFSLLTRIACYGVKDERINKKDIVNKLLIEHRRNLKVLLHAPISLSRKTIALLLGVSFPLTERIAHAYFRYKGGRIA